MQFYLSGYAPGDPDIRKEKLPATVDVLIVGSGPAGALLAAQLSNFPSISTRLIERRDGALQVGQADGIACRTVEMFEAFGLGQKLVREAYWVNETVFWRPSPQERGRIVRTGRIQDTEDGLSEFPHVIVNQARLQQYLLDYMRMSPTRLEANYGLEFVTLKVEPELGSGLGSVNEHPVVVTLRDVANGSLGTVRAKYVVGCDGARSAVRESIGAVPSGEFANHAWGVVDMLATTDFPDIRLKAAIQSADEGNILLIPREGGYLVRLYVDLGEIDPNQREAFRDNTQDKVIAIAQRVLRPYTLDVKNVVWFAVYQVGQRVTDRFDDVPAGQIGSRLPRVFIAGDACHTHSAKAGQGMNVSMQDAFNLGWKLSAVLDGRAKPELLRTYSAERHAIAQELIAFDKEWSKIMASPPKDPSRPELGGVDPQELQAYFVKSGRYTAGVATHYGAANVPTTVLTAKPTHQALAKGFTIGMRFHSAAVVRLADAKPMQLGHAARADGAWRIYAFADARAERLRELATHLAEFADPPVHPNGGRQRQRHRLSRDLPAGAPRPRGRGAAGDSAAAQGLLRSHRLRESLLPRSSRWTRHL
jgi:phenol 2-monooxygenase (NADPH)